MITVYVRESGRFRELQAKGHASYAPAGQDIVCSAFSMLIYSLMDYISHKKRASIYCQKIDSGNVEIGFNALTEDALHAFDVVVNGMKLLAENNPENIVIHGNFPENI